MEVHTDHIMMEQSGALLCRFFSPSCLHTPSPVLLRVRGAIKLSNLNMNIQQRNIMPGMTYLSSFCQRLSIVYQALTVARSENPAMTV
jgi:hypothetical protein